MTATTNRTLPFAPAIEARLAVHEHNLAAHEQKMFETIEQLRGEVRVLGERLSFFQSRRFLERLSEIHPKSRTVVFFAGSGDFGNLKYAFLSFCDYARDKNIKCAYVPYDAAHYEAFASAGLPCLPVAPNDWTEDNIATLLGAKIIVIDEVLVEYDWRRFVPIAFVQGAKCVQLWHGVPVKRIGFENLFNTRNGDPWQAEVHASCGIYDVFVGTEAKARDEWARSFSFHTYAPIGYPRNDVLLRDLTAQDRIHVDADLLHKVQEASKNKIPVVLYAPTVRDSNSFRWLDSIDITKFVDHCQSRGYLLCANLHPREQPSTGELQARMPGLHCVKAATDIYPILKYADIVITDYSSIAYDFLLLDRPIVIFRPDHAEYTGKSRKLIDDHANYVCGEVVDNAQHLIHAVDLAVECRKYPAADPFRAKRQSLRQKFFDHQDAGASDRLNALIVELLDSP